MSLSPADILQRLKQLKLWQESQDVLLKKTKTLMDSSPNRTTASDYETIDGLSAFDSTHNSVTNVGSVSKKVTDIESLVISPTRSFNELLEEKLAQDPGPEDVVPKPKRPFLKKGTGLERFRLKPQLKPNNINRIRKSHDHNKSARSVTPLRAPDLSVKPKATWSKADESSEHVRKINAELEKSEQRSEQTLFEKQLEKELLIFEALEQRADNSSFCSTNSSVVRILSSTPSRVQETIPEEKRVHWESESEEEMIETDLDRRDIADLFLRLKNLTENNIPPQVPSVIRASDDEKWSSSEPSSGDTSITSTDLEATLRSEKRDVGVGTHEYSSDNCAICGDKFQRKINEYENKIREVLEDKNRISELRTLMEQKQRDFFKKKREFEDERQDLIFQLETEKKKLIKEKQAFQTYMKDSQNRPNKKERQEISNLKQEVADLTETLKLKESKNGMTQARLRNQIKQLEKDASNLKDEVEKLTKENAKLSATQSLKRKSSDTKMLHEISKNITKLAQETRKSGQKPEQKEIGDERSSLKRSFQSVVDSDDSFLEMQTNRNHVDLEYRYESNFRKQSPREVTKTIGKIERNLDDGSKQIKYPNGNVKTVSPDGNLILVEYFNGDKQETNLPDGTVKYYFSKKNICQTTYADGIEIVEYPEGVTEKRHTDGRCEVVLPDGVVQTTFPDGMQETTYTDGSIVKINSSGDKMLFLPNGQKEIETKEYKRREYPDGTVKILYPDGTQETKYANGRVRIKDGNGILVVDTQS